MIFSNKKEYIPMHSLRSRGLNLFSRGGWFIRSHRVDRCHEGWDGFNDM